MYATLYPHHLATPFFNIACRKIGELGIQHHVWCRLGVMLDSNCYIDRGITWNVPKLCLWKKPRFEALNRLTAAVNKKLMLHFLKMTILQGWTFSTHAWISCEVTSCEKTSGTRVILIKCEKMVFPTYKKQCISALASKGLKAPMIAKKVQKENLSCSRVACTSFFNIFNREEGRFWKTVVGDCRNKGNRRRDEEGWRDNGLPTTPAVIGRGATQYLCEQFCNAKWR